MRKRLLSVLSGIHLVVVVISAISFEARAEIDVLEATRIAETMLLREEQVGSSSLEFEAIAVIDSRYGGWFSFLSDFTCECVLKAYARDKSIWCDDVPDKEMRDKLKGREYLLVYFSSVDPEVDYEIGFFIDAMTAELIYVYRSTLSVP